MAIKAVLPAAFFQFNAKAVEMKSQATTAIAVMAANPVNANYIFAVLNNLKAYKSDMEGFANTPNFATFAQNIVGGAYDVDVELAALVTQLDAVISWIIANIPRTADNKLTVRTVDPVTGDITDDVYQPAATAGLRTALQNLAVFIE